MRILPEITFYELRKDLIQYCSGFLWGQGECPRFGSRYKTILGGTQFELKEIGYEE